LRIGSHTNRTFLLRLARLKKIIAMLKLNNFKLVLNTVEDFFEQDKIRIAYTSKKGLQLFGLAKDITYDSMVSGEFREPHFKDLVDLLLKENYNCLDLGANFGSHAMLMATKCKRGRIFAFEPQSLVFQCLTLNVYLNNFLNITPINMAVGFGTGNLVSMEQIRADVEEVNSGFSRLVDSQGFHKAITLAIDDLVLPRISFIKMDIQGSELQAFQGMKALLMRDRPIVFFEVEEVHLTFRGATVVELFNEISKNNFVIYRIENEYPSDHLAIPAEKVGDFESIISKSLVGKIIAKVKRIESGAQN
jgi:FkbM family methyltransferase